jgi:hypothetical protein
MNRPPKPRLRLTRAQRATVAADLAPLHGGVAHRRDLRARGVTRADVRSEVAAGRWSTVGKHTVVISAEAVGPTPLHSTTESSGQVALTGEALWWRALWETGAGGALDGIAALAAAGMTGFTSGSIDVSIPTNNRRHDVDGVVRHHRTVMPPTIAAGLPRVKPEWAMLHAAQWAVSERQAALIVCLPLQQRLVRPDRVLAAWQSFRRGPRHDFLDAVVRDVCDGAHSLGELDFGSLCAASNLPKPSRQVVRTLPNGRVYLDVGWDGVALVVEIDGGHHALALNPVDDALRQNDVVLDGQPVLRIPVLGLRLMPDEFMAQVVRGHMQGRASAA